MKKYLSFAFLSLLFIVPFQSHAQSDATTTPTTHQQYISELKSLLALLEQELQMILVAQQTTAPAQQPVTNIQTTSTTSSTIALAQTTNTSSSSEATSTPTEPQLSCQLSYNTSPDGGLTKQVPDPNGNPNNYDYETVADLDMFFWTTPVGATATLTADPTNGGSDVLPIDMGVDTGLKVGNNMATDIVTSNQVTYTLTISEPGYASCTSSKVVQ